MDGKDDWCCVGKCIGHRNVYVKVVVLPPEARNRRKWVMDGEEKCVRMDICTPGCGTRVE